MIDSVANIIDIGGESTRPGSKTVSNKKEWKRIEHVIKQFKKVYIALDKDATGKAILMMKKLRNYVPTKLIVLNKDLKDMQIGERNEFIRRYID